MFLSVWARCSATESTHSFDIIKVKERIVLHETYGVPHSVIRGQDYRPTPRNYVRKWRKCLNMPNTILLAQPLCDSRAACSVTVDNDTRLQAYITHFYQLHFTVLPLWRVITVWPTCSRDSMYCMYTLLSFIVGIVKELQKNKPLSLQWGRCQHRVFVSYHQTKFLSPRHACLPSVTRVSYDWLVGSRQNVDNLLAVLQKHFNEMH